MNPEKSPPNSIFLSPSSPTHEGPLWVPSGHFRFFLPEKKVFLPENIFNFLPEKF